MKATDNITCICTGCERRFMLTADSDSIEKGTPAAHLAIRGCDSGGIYAVFVECR